MLRVAALLALLASCGDDSSPVTPDAPPGERCGDGVVTGGEECDGATESSCAQLGFYGGSTACTSACVVDATGCTGRCGDSIVQADHGEACDGMRPATGTCVTHGKDYGVLDCTTACMPDSTTRCRVFGDAPLLSTTAAIQTLAANRRGVIALEDTSLDVVVSWDGVVTRRSGTGWTAVAASGAILIGLGPTGYGWYDGTWHDHTVALGTSPAAAATSTGLLYVVSPDCTAREVSVPTGAVTALPAAPASACATPVTVLDQLYVAAGAAGVLRWNSTAWVTVLTSPTDAIARGTREHLIANSTSVLDLDLSLTPPATRTLPLPTGRTLASDLDGTVIAVGSAGAATIIVDGVLTLLPSNTERSHAVQSEDGAIVEYGAGARRFEPRPIATDVVLDQAGDLDLQSDGSVAYCGAQIGWLAGATRGTRPWTGAPCTSLVGNPRSAHVILAGSQLYRWDGSSAYTSLGDADAIAGDGTQWFMLLAGAIYTETGAAPMPAGCSASDLDGPPGALYAVGTCMAPSPHAAVMKWNGSAFVELAVVPPEPLTRAFVVRDGTLFASGTAMHRLDGTSFVDATAGTAVFGDSKDNYWVAAPGGGSLLHVQGALVTEVRVPAAGAIEISDRAIYGWDPAAMRVTVTPRDSLRLTNLGL